MFNRKVSKELDIKKVNEVADLASRVLRVFYLLLIAAIAYVVIRLFKETKILDFVFKILEICLPLFIGIFIAWLFDPTFLPSSLLRQASLFLKMSSFEDVAARLACPMADSIPCGEN